MVLLPCLDSYRRPLPLLLACLCVYFPFRIHFVYFSFQGEFFPKSSASMVVACLCYSLLYSGAVTEPVTATEWCWHGVSAYLSGSVSNFKPSALCLFGFLTQHNPHSFPWLGCTWTVFFIDSASILSVDTSHSGSGRYVFHIVMGWWYLLIAVCCSFSGMWARWAAQAPHLTLLDVPSSLRPLCIRCLDSHLWPSVSLLHYTRLWPQHLDGAVISGR